MTNWTQDLLWLGFAAVLVVANGFFVAAEFALVKIRMSQVQAMVDDDRPFSGVVKWLMQRLDATLSACQLGITMASLGLGWIGEPAFARLLEPMLHALGVTNEAYIHTISFAVAFTLITAIHIVIGEQVPKIYAIRKPEITTLATAWPMKLFYYASYPLMKGLNSASNFLLRRLGIRQAVHDETHTEEEIRVMLQQAHTRGELSRSEHRLLNAVFEFDDMVSRRIMVPRSEVISLDAGAPLGDWFKTIRRTRHTRYPVVEGSLDKVTGMVHIKDLVGAEDDSGFDRKEVVRPALKIPETMPVSQLLRHFQSIRQHMALVVDEFGNTIGMVTMENVLEQIVGSVEDEFDEEVAAIVEEGQGRFLVRGMTPLEIVRRRLDLDLYLDDAEVDTFSGYLVVKTGKLLEAGQKVDLGKATAEVLEVKNGRATRVRVTFHEASQAPQTP